MSRLLRNYSWMVWIVVTKMSSYLPTLFTHQRRYSFSILWRWLGPFIDGYFFHRSHEWSVESDILMDMVGGPIPTPIQCTVFGKREINHFQPICFRFAYWIRCCTQNDAGFPSKNIISFIFEKTFLVQTIYLHYLTSPRDVRGVKRITTMIRFAANF